MESEPKVQIQVYNITQADSDASSTSSLSSLSLLSSISSLSSLSSINEDPEILLLLADMQNDLPYLEIELKEDLLYLTRLQAMQS